MRAPRLLVAALSAAAFSLVPIAAAERVQEVGEELAGSFAAPLLAYAAASHDDGLRTLVINGARLRLRSGTTRDGIDEVLDAQAVPCRPEGQALNPIVRTRRAEQGFVGCIVPRASESFAERWRAFAETHDLAALGELRVTWAMQSPIGTRYVAIASDGALDLLKMFPGDGDAPGTDLPELPRPPETRRLLSTFQEGADAVLLSYESTLPLETLATRYAAALAASSERVDTVPRSAPNARVLAVQRKGQRYLAILAADGDGTLISIIPLADDATAPWVGR